MRYLLFLLCLLAATHSHSEPIHLVADEWCPYTCNSQAETLGLMTEIVIQTFKAGGIEARYRSVPWLRAIRQVRTGNATVLLGADAEMDKKLLLSKAFTIYDNTALVVRTDFDDSNLDLQDLNAHTIGIISSYSYSDSEIWETMIENHRRATRIDGGGGEKRLIELLAAGRFEIAIANRDVANYQIKTLSLENKIKIITTPYASEIFLGFTKSKRGQYLMALFEKEFEQFSKSPEYFQLLEKYGFSPPEQ